MRKIEVEKWMEPAPGRAVLLLSWAGPPLSANPIRIMTPATRSERPGPDFGA